MWSTAGYLHTLYTYNKSESVTSEAQPGQEKPALQKSGRLARPGTEEFEEPGLGGGHELPGDTKLPQIRRKGSQGRPPHGAGAPGDDDLRARPAQLSRNKA